MITPVGFSFTDCSSLNKLTRKPARKIEFIVVHYCASLSDTPPAAQNVARWFRTGNVQASADYIVGKRDIVVYNKDPENYYSWHCGDKLNPYKSFSEAGRYYGVCRNSNSIGVELVNYKINTKSQSVYDDDWAFSPETIKNAIMLVAFLAEKYGIDESHIITHAHCSGKLCPQPFVLNEARYSQFLAFRSAVTQYRKDAYGSTPAEPVAEAEPFYIKVLAEQLRVRTGPSVAYPPTGVCCHRGKAYTIVEENDGWGRLKSGAGWISLDSRYVQRIDREALEELLKSCV